MKLWPTGPKFGLTLRGMLLIMALLAVGMALVGTKVRRAREERSIARATQASGGWVQYEYGGLHAASFSTDRTWFERLTDLDLEARVEYVDLRGPQVTDADVARLAGLAELRGLGLHDLAIDGAALAALDGLPKLAHLDVWNCALSDEGIEAIARLPALESLAIDKGVRPSPSRMRLSETGLAALRQARSLKRLSLWGAHFTDARLRELSGLAQVEGLELWDTGLTDDGLEAMLDGMTGLRSLLIYHAPISGRGLAKLRDCPRLLSVRLDCPITDEGLASLAEVQQLGFLQMSSSRTPTIAITDDGLRHLAKLVNLTQLHLHGSQFNDESVRRFAALPALTELGLYGATGTFTDQALAHLKSAKNLKSVSLTDAASPAGLRQFSPAAIEDLQRAVPGVVVRQ